MFLKDKRGQSALEYLMTYGWALIVIVIVIAALVFLINPQQVGTEGCTGFARLPIGNFQVSEAGLTVKITNETGRSLQDVQFSGTFTQGSTVNSVTDANTTIAVNAEKDVVYATLLTTGAVTADLNVTYHDGDFTRSATASCKGTVA